MYGSDYGTQKCPSCVVCTVCRNPCPYGGPFSGYIFVGGKDEQPIQEGDPDAAPDAEDH